MNCRTDDLVEKQCLPRHRKLCMELVGKTRSGCKIPVATQAFVKVELLILLVFQALSASQACDVDKKVNVATCTSCCFGKMPTVRVG